MHIAGVVVANRNATRPRGVPERSPVDHDGVSRGDDGLIVALRGQWPSEAHQDDQDGCAHRQPCRHRGYRRRIANVETLPSGARPSVTRMTLAPFATS